MEFGVPDLIERQAMDDSDWPPPPAGALIRKAREMAIPRITVRKGAQSAGVSPEVWGIAERGYRDIGGERRPVTTRPETLAKMAFAVGVTPDQMERIGEHDVAGALRELLGKDNGTDPPAASVHAVPAAMADRPQDEEDAEEKEIQAVLAANQGLAEVLQLVRDDIAKGVRKYGIGATGRQIFSSPSEAAFYDSPRWSPLRRELLIAQLRQAAADQARRTGTRLYRISTFSTNT